MNAYLATGLVMCGVIVIAIAATAYLAVFFNRRAKADLNAALIPLAEVIGGEIDLEHAEVKGWFQHRLSMGRMTNAENSPARVFQTEIIDAAGGVRWVHISAPPRKDDTAMRIEFECERAEIREHLRGLTDDELATVADLAREWVRVEYNPEGGYVRLTRPMRTRKDIPSAERFERQLSFLVRLGDQNRTIQEHLAATDRDES